MRLPNIPTDKLGHLKAGALVALFCAGVTGVLSLAGYCPVGAIPATVLLGPVVAGLTKEEADREANLRLQGVGVAPMFGVDALDVLWTAAPGLLGSPLAALVIRLCGG